MISNLMISKQMFDSACWVLFGVQRCINFCEKWNNVVCTISLSAFFLPPKYFAIFP